LQVAQVLLTLPYSFSQLGMLSGVLLQIFYGFLGSWTAYLISVLYVEYRSRKEKEGVSFKNHVIQVWLRRRRRLPPAPLSPPRHNICN
jgi:auxin influx carrier (AUX1 LAX family)